MLFESNDLLWAGLFAKSNQLIIWFEKPPDITKPIETTERLGGMLKSYRRAAWTNGSCSGNASPISNNFCPIVKDNLVGRCTMNRLRLVERLLSENSTCPDHQTRPKFSFIHPLRTQFFAPESSADFLDLRGTYKSAQKNIFWTWISENFLSTKGQATKRIR